MICTSQTISLLPSTLAQGPGREGIQLFPETAARGAESIDGVFWALTAMSLVFMVALFGLMALFLIRYRAGSPANRRGQIRNTTRFELTWIVAIAVVWAGLFVWASVVYFNSNAPPQEAATYHVIGRQWMWEAQHPNGRRELNTLHVPVDRPVKLVLSSEDVIHSFYVPAFRMKQDAVPGRYTTAWFTPTEPGVYHLFCAEYCGSDHARMTGQIFVMRQAAYERWLEEHPPTPTVQPMEDAGRTSFQELGCSQCHRPETDAIAPYLEGLFGRERTLRDGSTVTADEQYIRESIINPAAKVVRGYQPIMPTYKGMLNEQQINQLVTAIRGLGSEAQTQGGQEENNP